MAKSLLFIVFMGCSYFVVPTLVQSYISVGIAGLKVEVCILGISYPIIKDLITCPSGKYRLYQERFMQLLCYLFN